MKTVYNSMKQLSLICAGALLGLIPTLYFADSKIIKDSNLVFTITLGLLLLGFGVFDLVPRLWQKLQSVYNNIFKNIAILSPYEIKEGKNSSWISLTVKEICFYIRQNSGYSVKEIRNLQDYPVFKVIVNPYGGVYPEDNVADLESFKKIINYVKNGGIFINIADIPFYYAYDRLLKRMVDTTPLASGIYNYPLRSFFNTLVSERLKCLIVGTNPIPKEGKSEIARVSNVESTTINLFDKTYPLFMENGTSVTGSPVVKIPYGRGYFIFSTIELKKDNIAVLDYCLKGISDIFD